MTTVDVCLFSYRTVSTNALMGIQEMIRQTQAKGVQVGLQTYGNALIHRARNDALARVDSAATHVLFVDDDMLPEPDALLKLLKAEKPVISALCTTRSFHDIRIAAKVYNPANDGFGWLDTVNLERVVTGPFAPGTAFLLIDRATIATLIDYYLTGRDWLDENCKAFNRLHVRAEQREKERARIEALRRQHYAESRVLRVFDFPVADTQLQLGEDICLGRKLMNLGIPVSLDGTTCVGHLGEYPYTVDDILRAERASV